MDVPCFINSDAVEKSTEFTFIRALEERDLGIIQIFASVANNCNHIWSNLEADIDRVNNSQSIFIGCNVSMPVSQEHIDYVISLYSCFNDNTLGKKTALRK